MSTEIADALTQRINESTQPSRFINQLHEIDTRSGATARRLATLMARAPRCLGVIRAALRETFGLDPDALLFIETGAPGLGPRVSTLTERALGLLSNPFVPTDIHHTTRLSIKHEPNAHLSYNAAEILEQVKGLALLARLDTAVTGYWQQLAYGTWLTRAQQWGVLSKSLFADKAFMARQLAQLSGPAYELVCHLVDAPSLEARHRAGGAWAQLQVDELLWPGTYQPSLPIPGALHLSRGGSGLQVIYLPGLIREFHEFGSWAQLQCELPALLGGALFESLWQCLPLRRRHEVCPLPEGMPAAVQRGRQWQGDALEHSALAVREGQWDNELACALSINQGWVSFSAQAQTLGRGTARYLAIVERARKRLSSVVRLKPLINDLLAWDQRRRASHIIFPSLSPGHALRAREQQLHRYENGLSALLDSRRPDSPGEAYPAIFDLNAQAQAQAGKVREAVHASQEHLFDQRYWLEPGDGARKRVDHLLLAQRKALLCEVRIQHRLHLIDDADLQRWEDVMRLPVATKAGKLQVVVGSDEHSLQPLLGVLVIQSTASAMLWVMGRQGGLARFDSLDALSAALKASLLSADGSELWRCVPRGMRQAARTALQDPAWRVTYAAIEKHPLQHLFLGVFKHYAQLEKNHAQPNTLFSEVADPALARALLADEMSEQLCMPFNAVLAQALAGVDLWRLAATRARQHPVWLANAPASQRKHYRRLQTHYLAGALAFEDKLWQTLPELDVFARTQLIERLSQDGLYPGVDIDQPLLDMPDDVSRYFCGWSSQCVVGDRHVKTVVSAQRTTFSLLQLALHNLDSQAPWTEWRLNHARYLTPALKARLSPAYLIKMIAELDLGGRYHARAHQVFYPAANGLIQALSERASQQLARLQLYSATQQGLDARGQSLFKTAIGARQAQDLLKHGHRLQLCFLRLVGYTLEHDRHIAGVLVFHDLDSDHCVVYWPAAFEHPAITQYASLRLARDALNREVASASRVKRLARQVAPGWEAEALASYPGAVARVHTEVPVTFAVFKWVGFGILSLGESIARFIRSFKVKHRAPVVVLAAIETQIHEQIAAAPHAWLEITPTSHANPLALLTHARLLEIQHRSQGVANSGALLVAQREQRLGEQRDATIRGLLSFVPVIGVGISLYEMLLAARRYHHSHDPREAVDVAFLTLMSFLDVMTAWVPGARGRAVGQGVVRASLSRLRLSSVPARMGLPNWRTMLTRPSTLLERFRKGPHAPGAVALQTPGQVGLQVHNGEQFLVVDGHRYPVYRRKDERGLRLKNQQADGADELLLFIEEPREWLLGADAPEPQPGPSSAMWRPWAASDATEWTPPSNMALQRTLPQMPMAPGGWQAWGFFEELTLIAVEPSLGIFEVAGRPSVPAFEVLRLGGRYYRLLPQGGSAARRTLVFITPNRPLAHMASVDIIDWLGVGLGNQPHPATRGANGLWTIHRPLFSEPLETSLHQAFPTMTPGSRRFLIQRLSELADTPRPLTATRLLNLRATLDKWLTPQALGQTDDLLRLLRPIDSQAHLSVWIGLEGITPGFSRVDFFPPEVLSPLLRHATRLNLIGRYTASQRAVRIILEQQGFDVRVIVGQPGSGESVHFVCTHPASNNLYYVMNRWANDTTMNLDSRQAVQLTDDWFRHRFTVKRFAVDYAPVKKAMDEQRLVKIIAGIQWTWTAEPTVFFSRFSSVRPGATKPRLRPRTKPH